MRKKVFGLLLLSLLLSCKSQDSKEDFKGTWIEVQKRGNEFLIIDCEYKGEDIKIINDSIFENGIMESTKAKIDHIKEDETGVLLFIDKTEKSYYKFLFVNKEKGLAKWEIKNNDLPIVIKYFVNEASTDKIKKIKGTKADCISNDDVGDSVNDSLTLNNGNVLLVEDGNCISLLDKKENLIVERCFDNCNVKIRHIKTAGLPLTIISGQNSIDIEFHKKGVNWVSNSAAYFKSLPTGEEKNTKQIEVSIKDFDFDRMIEQFGDTKNNDLSSSLDDIKNKQKLIELDIYKIADILKNNPVSDQNITLYNDAALTLIENENFNEARIILLDVTNFSPDRVVAYLNLGDAQWGFDENEDAKKSYQKYLSLMKSQNKDLNKVPKRVYERIK
ncbi:tetratricopeptide repeat protein [Flavobacterium johnsoniae]|uniref:tetratricopeptide repeat protein n=1 Tax=Flavobacterium johnsoniae TaxID=986 RepID=UPI003D99FB64